MNQGVACMKTYSTMVSRTEQYIVAILTQTKRLDKRANHWGTVVVVAL